MKISRYFHKIMVYRRFIGPRRKPKRRKRRKRKGLTNARIARIARNAVLKDLGGNRAYKYEDRNRNYANGHGQYSWNSLLCIGNTSSSAAASLKTIIEATGAQDGVALAGDADDAHKRFRVYDFSATVHVRNLSPHPIFLTMYELQAKKHIEFNDGGYTCTLHALGKMYDGWQELMDATGDAYLTAPSGLQMMTESNLLFPSDSKHFSAFYKVVKKKKFKMEPGDDIYWTVKMPPFTLRPNVFIPTGMAGTDRAVELIKNYSKFLMCKMEGALGHQTTDQTIIGPMSCDIAVERQVKAKAYAINTKDDGSHVRRTEDSITGDLEGPSHVAMLQDD